MIFGDQEYTSLGEEVGEQRDALLCADESGSFNGDLFLPTIALEIEDAQKVEVGGIVPFIGQGRGYGRSSAEEDLQS